MAEDENCCEPATLADWDRKTVELKGKSFMKKGYGALFYMPFGAEKAILSGMEQLGKNWNSEEIPRMLWREGMFGGEVLFSLRKSDSSLKSEDLSGEYFTMGFEGRGFGESGKWHAEFMKEAKKRGLKVRETLVEYVMCPRCAKKYGKIQAIIFGRLG